MTLEAIAIAIVISHSLVMGSVILWLGLGKTAGQRNSGGNSGSCSDAEHPKLLSRSPRK